MERASAADAATGRYQSAGRRNGPPGPSFAGPVGALGLPMARRALLAVAAALILAIPLPGLPVAAAPERMEQEQIEGDTGLEARSASAEVADPDRPRAERFSDPVSGLALTPPAGWVQSPVSALNPLSDPPEPVQETARFQLRIGDARLYLTPIPITSGLVADATAVISVGTAREGSDLLAIDRGVRGTREVGGAPGFTTLEEEATYEGLHVLTRYLFSRESARVIVVRAAVAETAWADYADQIRASLATFGGDAKGANAPAPLPPPPPPPPPPAPPVVAEAAPDPTVLVRAAILSRASTLLGLRYVWGGDSTVNGMDCSSYVSWVWSVSRYTTDSIWNTSFPITKEGLRAGDALNLTIGRDPQRQGHIRLFEAWANTAHTAMWVYEETPPRVVHRVVAYDDRYQPIRLAGLSGAGDARLIPGTPAPERTAAPRRATPVPTRRATPVPTRTPVRTNRPLTTARPSASGTPRPSGSVAPTAPAAVPTPRPSSTAP